MSLGSSNDDIQRMTARASAHSGQESKDKHPHSLKKLSRKTTCLKCHEGGDVLVCGDHDCPIVIHKSCMSCAAHFDDTGSFYCPYCLYKQSLVKCRHAKEKVLLAKNTLVSFLDTKTARNTGHLQFSRSLKRKKPDAPITIQNRDFGSWSKVEMDGVHQPMQEKGGQKDYSPELETLACDQQEEGSSMSIRGSAANDDVYLTKKPLETVKTVDRYYNGRVEKDQTYTKLQELSVCYPRENNTTKIHEKLDKGSDCIFPNYCLIRSQMVIKSQNAGLPYEIGYLCGRIDEEQPQTRSLKNDVNLVKKNRELLSKESGNLTKENQEAAKTVQMYRDGGLEREQMPQVASICLNRKDNLNINEDSDKENYSAFEDDFCLKTQMIENFDQPAEIGDHCGRKEECETQPKIAFDPMWNDSESVMYHESGNSTFKPLEGSTVERYCDRVVVKVQIEAEPQKTSVCLTREDKVAAMNEESDEVKDNPFQGHYALVCQMAENSKKANQSAEMGEGQCGRPNKGQTQVKSPRNTASYPAKKDNQEVTLEELENSTRMHEETAKTVEGYHDEVVDWEQTEGELQESSVCLTRKGNTIQMYEETVEVNDNASQDDYFLRSLMAVNSEKGDQSVRIGENCSGKTDGGQTQLKSLPSAVFCTMVGNAPVTHESGNFSTKHQKTKNTVEGYDDGVVEKEQPQTEPRDTRIDNAKEMNEESDEVNDSASQGGYHDGVVEKEQTQTEPRDTVIDDAKEMNKESDEGNDSASQGVYNDGAVEQEQTQTEPRDTRIDGAKEMNEESDEGNDSASASQGEYFSSEMVVNENSADQTVDIGEDHCGETDEGKIQVKSLKNAVELMSMKSPSMTHEECDSGNDSESSQNNYHTGHGIHAKQKSQMPENSKNGEQPGELSGPTESEHEEYDVVTRSRSKKKVDAVEKIKLPALPLGRRRKLPWTEQEVQMLKEGVQKFSLMTNKNIPWVKILEFGRHIFDGTRTPVDLKDKWRNIMGK